MIFIIFAATLVFALMSCSSSTEEAKTRDLTFQTGVWLPEPNNLKVGTNPCYGCFPEEPTAVPTFYFGEDGAFRMFDWHLWYVNNDSLIDVIPYPGRVFTGTWKREMNAIKVSYLHTHDYPGMEDIPKYEKFLVPTIFLQRDSRREKPTEVILGIEEIEGRSVLIFNDQTLARSTQFPGALSGVLSEMEQYVLKH